MSFDKHIIKEFVNTFINNLLWVCTFRQIYYQLMVEFQTVRTLKQQFNKVCTKPNLYSSGIKLMKISWWTKFLNFKLANSSLKHWRKCKQYQSMRENVFRKKQKKEFWIVGNCIKKTISLFDFAHLSCFFLVSNTVNL